MNGSNKIVLDIPAITVLKVVGVFAALALLYVIRDVLVMFFIVLIIVAALSPVVDNWSQKMPRQLAVSIIYIGFLTVVGGMIYLMVPPVVSQIQGLSQVIPELIQRISPTLESYKNINQVSQGLSSVSSQISGLGSSIWSTTLGVIGGIIAAVTLIFLSFYLLLDEQGAKKFIKAVLPPDYKDSAIETANKISIKMGAWMRGQLTLMLIVGSLYLVSFLILGIPYALTLALWGGLTEAIAFVGPVIGAIPVIIIAYTVNPILALIVVGVFVVVQQVEANFLVPKIMGKAVGLSPVIIIFSILVGAKLLGILGVVLAIPAAGAISVILQEWPKLRGFKDD